MKLQRTFIYIAGVFFAVGFAASQAAAGTGVPGCSIGPIGPIQIEVNQLRAGGKTVVTSPGDTTKVTAKARMLTGTAPSGATMDVTLTIEIRDGAIPTNCIDADVGTLLATLTFNATSFQGATDANPGATANANTIIGETNAPASSVATYFRCKSNAGVVVTQGEVGTSGADMNLDTTTINSGDTVDLTDWDIVLPEA